MRIYKTRNYEELSRRAAMMLSSQIHMKPDCVLGLATGSSPIGTYKKLVEWYDKGDLDFSKVKTINLDEYKGLKPIDEQSYYKFMQENLFSKVNIEERNTYIPNGVAENADRECLRYSQIIQEVGGIDMQLLGLGHNGHIGFNEPGDFLEKDVHCVDLSETTINANKRFFEKIEDVPKQAYTVGIKNIMNAKKVVVIVSGKEKASIVKQAFWGPVTPLLPASILQLHKDVILIADEPALSLV